MVWRHFARWGTVADVYFPGKRGHKRVNYCFVTFEDRSCAQRACDQSERTVHGWVSMPMALLLWLLLYTTLSPMLIPFWVTPLQPLDSISLAGARKQEAQLHLAPHSLPSSTAQPHDQVAAAQMASLAGSPGYTLWLRQQLDQLQASMSAQASATFMPPHSAQPDSLTRFKPQHQDLMSSATEQQQYIYMQGVQDGMRSNSLPAAALEFSDRYATSPLDGYAAHSAGASGVHGISHPPALFPPSSAGAASVAGHRPGFMPGHNMSDSQLLTQSNWQHPHGSQPAPHFIPAGLEQHHQQQQQLERSWHAHQAISIGEYGVLALCAWLSLFDLDSSSAWGKSACILGMTDRALAKPLHKTAI